MKRISNSEVELTNVEQFAWEFFEDQLDLGHGIGTAVELTKRANTIFEALDDRFYNWLATAELLS